MNIPQAARKGSSRLKPPAIAARADAISKATCREVWTANWGGVSGPDVTFVGDTSACGGPGTLDDGATCYLDGQCKGGLCVWPADGACATCVTPAAGNPCEGDGQCGEGFWCRYPAKLCEQRKAVGQKCTQFTECVESAYCDSSAEQCKVRKALDETCDTPYECQWGLVCKTNGKCGLASYGQANDSCTNMESGSCAGELNLYCLDSTNTCIELPFPEVGEACGNTALDAGVTLSIAFCKGDAACVLNSGGGFTGTCKQNAADGAPCGVDLAGCTFPARCANGTCVIPSPTTCPAN